MGTGKLFNEFRAHSAGMSFGRTGSRTDAALYPRYKCYKLEGYALSAGAR